MATDKPTTGHNVTLEGIKAWLPLLLMLATLLVSLGVVQQRVAQVELKTAENTAAIKTQSTANTDMLVRLTRIETDIAYIRESLEKMQEK